MSAARESPLVDVSVPRGPFARPPRELGEFAIDRGGDSTYAVRDWLRALLVESGVELGVYDEQILSWLSRGVDWPTVQVLAGWIARAAPSPPPGPKVTCPACCVVTLSRDRYCAFCDAWMGWVVAGDELGG